MVQITERQLEIIEAAGKILTQAGVSGLTVKRLSQEMHFSESALYRHFQSKEDIILSLLDYLAESMTNRYQYIIDQSKSAEHNLVALFQNQFAYFIERPYFIVAVFSDGLWEESEKINEAVLRIMKVKTSYLFPIISAGQKSGEFVYTISPQDLMHIVMGAFRLQMYKWRISDFEYDIQIEGNNMIQSILKLIKV